VNRESEPGDKSWPENRPRRNNIDADMAAADSEVAGVNLDSLSDLGAGEPVETSESASARLAETVKRALEENALTTGQGIEVEVVNGVARLHGRVAYLEDAEAAETVASAVPGIRYVQDELDILATRSED
jgi:osmotically-inducible protein OsmY